MSCAGLSPLDTEECWGTTLLQSSLQVAANQNEINPPVVSSAAVTISNAVIVVGLLLCCLTTLHEVYVQRGATPLLATRDGANSLLFQAVWLSSWIVLYVKTTMVATISLDFARAMGESATSSGVLVGMTYLGAVLGVLAGRWLTDQQHWDQRYSRKVWVVCYGIAVLSMLAIALVIRSAVNWSMSAKPAAFWLVVAMVLIGNTVFNVPLIPYVTMWNVMTPQHEKTLWSLLSHFGKNLGRLVGPALFTGLSRLLRGSESGPAPPMAMMSWVFLALFLLQAFQWSFGCLIFPSHLENVPRTRKGSDQWPENNIPVEDLPAASRQQTVWNVVYFGYERGFSIAAIEIATITILEVSYGWSPELCGVSFVVVASGSMILTAISAVVMSKHVVTEAAMVASMAILGFCGSILLFNFPFWGVGSLLAAEVIVCSLASVATGIAEGWACRAASEGTTYSIEVFRMHNLGGSCISAFLAPIIARFLLDVGGRNLYAGLQVFLCFLAAVLLCHTCGLVRSGELAPSKPQT